MLNHLFHRFVLAPVSLRLWLTLLLLGSLPTADLWAQASLDSPGQGSFQSGISLIHGWRCEPAEITVVIDDGPPLVAPYGATRGDTASVCNDDGLNGWGLTINLESVRPRHAYPYPECARGWGRVQAGDVHRRPPRRNLFARRVWPLPGAGFSRTRREYHAALE